MKRKNRTLTDVGKVHAALVELLIPVDLDSVYQEVVDQAVRLASAQYGTIFLANQKDGKFTRAYSTVPKSQQFSPRPKGNTYSAYTHSRFRIVSRKDLLTNHPEVDPDIHSVILIPLFFQKEKLGVLSLQTNLSMPFNKNHKESLRLFGNISSLAIRNAQLHTQKQKALETRDLFMSAASHEFKTPLSSIRAYAQLVQQKLSKGKAIPEKAVNAIIRNADRLTDMINSLFMASQVSAGTFNSYKEDFDLYTITKQSVDDLQIASTRNLQFSSNKKSVPFHGDKHQWVSVVMNLVRNAISYSPTNSPVEIELHVNKTHVSFKVRNEGKGITKSDIKHIFEKYFRSKQQKAGLGLGLFLCSQIVKAHHGTIKMTSLPNVETVVTVTLPL